MLVSYCAPYSSGWASALPGRICASRSQPPCGENLRLVSLRRVWATPSWRLWRLDADRVFHVEIPEPLMEFRGGPCLPRW